MIEASRRWFRRNRTNLLVGAGVVGAGYLGGQYVLGKIREARDRMRESQASKDNLRRRFEQNQEDCTYTVLALLPTIRDEIIGALPVEQITEQLQQERQERLKRLAASEAPSSEYPSAPPSTVDDASTASFIHTSQMGMSSFDESKPKKSKAQLWQDMKINSIVRALALLYTLSSLSLLTRIQLNLLGRRTYLSSVVSMASPPTNMQSSTISLEDRDDMHYDNAYGNDFETNRMYLTFSWWILHRGAKSILEKVMAAVKEVFAQVNIREDMTLERLSELIIEVRKRVEGATEQERRQQSWLEYLLPPKSEELFVINQANQADSSDSASPEPRSDPLDIPSISPSLRRLLDETADLIDSPTFSLVFSHLLDAGFSHLVDVRIAAEAFKANIPIEGARLTEIVDTKCKLAHILPVFCREAHAIVVGGGELGAVAGVTDVQPATNEYLVLMDRVHDLEAFAAVIYSSNFEYEAMDSPKLDGQQSIISMSGSEAYDKLEQSVISLSESAPIQKVKETAVSAKETALSLSKATKETAVALTESAKETAVSVTESAQETAVALTDSARGTAVALTDSARDTAASLTQSAKESARAVSESAKETAQSSIQSAKERAQSAKETAESLAQSAKETVDSVAQSTKETAGSVAQSTNETAGSVAQSTKETAASITQSAKETATSVTQSAKETAGSLTQSAKETATSLSQSRPVQRVKESAISLSESETAQKLKETAKSFPESTSLQESYVIHGHSQSSDPLGESAVNIGRSDYEPHQAGPDFESAWSKALGSEDLTQAPIEVVDVPAPSTDIDVVTRKSTTVPTMEAASELSTVSPPTRTNTSTRVPVTVTTTQQSAPIAAPASPQDEFLSSLDSIVKTGTTPSSTTQNIAPPPQVATSDPASQARAAVSEVLGNAQQKKPRRGV